MKPLEGLLVLDFSQFLAGPSAALRLGDLGARVIKIERPGTGELNRQLSIKNQMVDGDSMLFHTINRGKESYAANLKDSEDAASVRALIARADVLIENFRPGTMEKLGLGYEAVKELNSGIVYASVTGYGQEGPWRDKPGQDLLIQSLSGLAWLNGNADQPPVPFGLAVADMFAGAHLVQGILACLVRRGRTGQGGRVEVSLLESALDLQFEVLTTHLNDGGELPQRSAVNNAHAYLGAPYGIYETKNGYLALAMGSVVRLGELLECEPLSAFQDPKTWFTQRDEIKQHLVSHIQTRSTEEWLNVLEPADYWCADVLTWERLFAHEGFKALDMVQEVRREDGSRRLLTTRCPIRINGERLLDTSAAPKVGEHTAAIEQEFQLRDVQSPEGQQQIDGGERA
ncbi:CaiB/BaiF CoA-transferase family protein [Paenibacillus sp. CF384]|uniref:CaiB/BaiF CoA transferase family protein n=1 Tax=Paenibacillus sp. CF384 TaxID=1884382 RepID=UPI0008968FA8|nr:CaiB/BaiF CoA-transferase family protein [Paenibacillus sp. CF384]SDW20651.1 Crotonobetainyl-CoA:carnitine CoA-transferase CaiB [Paenibacillus sp. CF384]